MSLKRELIQYLKENGKNDSWVRIYEKFPIRGHSVTNKQKSDTIRHIFKKNIKMSKSNETAVPLNEKHLKNYINTNPKENGQYLILGCVHAPFINAEFWKSIINFCKDQKNNIKGLIFNGDFLDLNSLSSHDKGRMPLKGVSLGYEYRESNKLLTQIERALNDNIYKGFIYGNHEDRYNRYISSPDNKKLEGAVLSPEQALNLQERGYNIYKDWKNDELQLGDLTIIHGEFFNVHLCKKYLDVFKKNMLMAHSHRVQVYKEGEHAAYNIGCLLDINAPVFNYASKAMKKTWSNAFAIANLYNGKTSVDIINWEKEYFWYGGKRY
jgi:hypothetical protein